MLNLRPLITRFVDDVLNALRAARLNELRELLATAADPSATAKRTPRAVASPQPPSRGLQVGRRIKAKRSTAPVRRVSVPRNADAHPADITDPERLLADSWFPPAIEAPSAWPLEATPDPPEEIAAARSTRGHPSGSKTSLRVGETLARDSGSGVVIRRAKKG